MVMQGGQLIQQGPPEQVYRQPVNAYAAGLFGSYNEATGPLANALLKQAGLPSSRKTLLVRPESLRLFSAAEDGLPGTVRQVRFLGSYSEVDVELVKGLVTLKTAAHNVQIGDKVHVALDAEGVWLV
ncbi:TOBE domain-containing protein [Hymenobacter translucens]